MVKSVWTDWSVLISDIIFIFAFEDVSNSWLECLDVNEDKLLSTGSVDYKKNQMIITKNILI